MAGRSFSATKMKSKQMNVGYSNPACGAALAARRAGLAPQGPARCKGEEAGLFVVFGCIGLSVPRKRDARRAVLAFSLGEGGPPQAGDEADTEM